MCRHCKRHIVALTLNKKHQIFKSCAIIKILLLFSYNFLYSFILGLNQFEPTDFQNSLADTISAIAIKKYEANNVTAVMSRL